MALQGKIYLESVISKRHFKKKILFIFRERGREGEKHQCERETLISCLSYALLFETELATQACALTGN